MLRGEERRWAKDVVTSGGDDRFVHVAMIPREGAEHARSDARLIAEHDDRGTVVRFVQGLCAACDGTAHAFLPCGIGDDGNRQPEEFITALLLHGAEDDDDRSEFGGHGRLRRMAKQSVLPIGKKMLGPAEATRATGSEKYDG